MRGVSLASFTGPGASARYICMPPTPSSGSTATASTMMPMPPSQCSARRHMFMACGSWSRPVITVEPVVERPDMLSKNASVKRQVRLGQHHRHRGASAVIAIHDRLTSR